LLQNIVGVNSDEEETKEGGVQGYVGDYWDVINQISKLCSIIQHN